MRVHCNLDKNLRINLFKSLNMKQKEIAKLINSWQPNVSRLIKGIHLPTIEQLMLLSKKTGYNRDTIIKNIKNIRIGFLTTIKPDKKFINYLFNIKKEF